MFSGIVISILTIILNTIGSVPDPEKLLLGWSINKNWVKAGDYYVFEAETIQIQKDCLKNPNLFILFPQVIHGVHELIGDNNLLQSSGDISFKTASPFYEQTSISCKLILPYSKIKWRVTSYSKFFARLLEPVKLVKSNSASILFNSTANTAAAGVLIVLSIFSWLIYYRRVSNDLAIPVVFSSFFFSFYFIFSENSNLGLNFSMLESHKIADIGVIIGSSFLFRAFVADSLISKKLYNVQIVANIISLFIIVMGFSGDIIQIGTIFPMPFFVISSVNILTNISIQSTIHGIKKESIFKGLSIFSFLFFGCNDIFKIFAIIDNFMLLPFGLVGAIFGLSLAVNREIENTYIERDGLLKNLDLKVNEKTAALQSALDSLKTTQSELVQSAKLASLGTLSAGIAHEINNSINYVNGALIPLERKIHSLIPIENRGIIDKLLSSIKEGTHLTIEIVKSLRTFTGLNQAEFKQFKIKDAVDSVLVILKSKLREINVEVEIPEELSMTGNLVSLNQVIMNLITNALDVLPQQNGKIKIVALTESTEIKLSIEDNGCGIPPDSVCRIFDPFFTTKEVGKGTGLGLHIVQKEIEKHHGKISVSSKVGIGTKFEIVLPMGVAEETKQGEVA